MKKLSVILLSLMFTTVLFCLSGCKKDRTIDCKGEGTPSNIILYDKPLPVIQCAIQGKWKYVYGKGGIATNTIQYYDDFYWSFTPDDRIVQSYKGDTVTNTTIKWVKDIGAYGGPTFIMKFYDKENVPWHYIIDNIHNDTLVFRDAYSFDAFYYYLIKL